MEKMLYKALHRGDLDDITGNSLRRVTLYDLVIAQINNLANLVECVLQHDVVSRIKMLRILLATHQFNLCHLNT